MIKNKSIVLGAFVYALLGVTTDHNISKVNAVATKNMA
jgi:hypothetical protein